MNDSRIETFAPQGFGQVGAAVTKFPIADGVYEIRVEIECHRAVPCDDIRRSSTALFNMGINPMDRAYVAEGLKPLGPSRQPAPVSTPNATKPKHLFAAEQTAKAIGCSSIPALDLAAQGPGFETYRARCTNGDTEMIRCDMGNCRALK